MKPKVNRPRPRSFPEWKALQRQGKLPAREADSVGYLLRLAREEAGLTQSVLAKRLGCSQQAVAQAERWQSNPTVEFLRRWATQCGRAIEIRIGDVALDARVRRPAPSRPVRPAASPPARDATKGVSAESWAVWA